MKILHYFLGFPPYRTGGLTKYAYDLMQAQVADGNEVICDITYTANKLIVKINSTTTIAANTYRAVILA